MLPTETNILTLWNNLTAHVFKDQFLGGLIDVAYPIEDYPFFADRIPHTSKGVKGITADIPFRTRMNSSTRATDGRIGHSPTGNPEAAQHQTFTLASITSAANVSLIDIEATNGDHNLMASLMTQAVEDIYKGLPRYYRKLLWTSTTGIVGVSSGVPAGVVVDIDNAGLWNATTGDRLKNIWPNQFLQVYSSGFVYKGTVQVLETDPVNDQFTILGDLPAPNAIANDDVFTVGDIGGKEQTYNIDSPGILDMIDDNNTFQNINRATAGNHWARAHMDATGGLPTFVKLKEFFHQLGQPTYAITDYRNVSWYYEQNFREDKRYGPNQTEFLDRYSMVTVDKTKLVEDDDALQDRIIVPDLSNCALYTKGGLTNVNGEGWVRIAGRWIQEWVGIQHLLLGAKDCRRMGAYTGVDRDAAA